VKCEELNVVINLERS